MLDIEKIFPKTVDALIWLKARPSCDRDVQAARDSFIELQQVARTLDDICAGCKNLMDSGERDCGMDFPPCCKRKLSPVR